MKLLFVLALIVCFLNTVKSQKHFILSGNVYERNSKSVIDSCYLRYVSSSNDDSNILINFKDTTGYKINLNQGKKYTINIKAVFNKNHLKFYSSEPLFIDSTNTMDLTHNFELDRIIYCSPPDLKAYFLENDSTLTSPIKITLNRVSQLLKLNANLKLVELTIPILKSESRDLQIQREKAVLNYLLNKEVEVGKIVLVKSKPGDSLELIPLLK